MLIVPTEEAMALKLVPTWFPNTVLRGALSYFGYSGVIRFLCFFVCPFQRNQLYGTQLG
jgi:hypothetical protein